MQLEDYFEFVGPDEILIRGTRIGIEVILGEYFAGNLPEEIVCEYPALSLEQVLATLTYYLHNRIEIDDYYQRWITRGDAAVIGQIKSSLIERLLQARAEAATR